MLPVIPVNGHGILQSKGPGQSVPMTIADLRFYSDRQGRSKVINGPAD